MARWRQKGPEPLASMPAELATFDAKEWAAPGEEPGEHGFERGNLAGLRDYRRCHRRYTDALAVWFDAHPGADWLAWLRSEEHEARHRERRASYPQPQVDV